MRPRTCAVVFLLAATMMGRASAQQQKGDVELQLQGSYFTTFATDISVNVGTIAGKFAPFITDHLQIGVGPTLTIATTTISTPSVTPGKTDTKSDTKTTFGSTLFITYSFLLADARTVPYLGASYYKVDFSNADERGWLGVNGGLRYFFTKRTSFDVSASFLKRLTQHESGSMLLFSFGLSFLI